jgi:hypothetical protein
MNGLGNFTESFPSSRGRHPSQMIPAQLTSVWDKARRKAAETLGTVQPLTEFPAEYIELETRLKHTEKSIQSFIGHCKSTLSSTAEPFPYADSVRGIFSKVSASVESLHESGRMGQAAPSSSPNTCHHRQAALLREASDNLPYGSPLASSLGALSNAYILMAEAKAEFEDVLTKRIIPRAKELIQQLASCREAEEAAEAAKFSLNSVKSKVKRAEPSDLVRLQQKLQDTQDAYMDAVEHAVRSIKAGCEEVVRQLAPLVQAVREAEAKYYRTASQVLQQEAE